MSIKLIDKRRPLFVLPLRIIEIVNGLDMAEADKELLLRDLAGLTDEQRNDWLRDLIIELNAERLHRR